MPFSHLMVLGGGLLAMFGSTACSPAGESSDLDPPATSAPTARDELAVVVGRTRGADVAVELVVDIAVDGVSEARLVARGRVEQRGDRFDLEIEGATPFGDGDRVEVRLIDGRLLQRGPVVAELFPAAGDRWVELTPVGSAIGTLGLIGPAGFAALDLLDDADDVRSPSAGRFEGTLPDLRIDGVAIVNVAESGFEVTVRDGLLGSMSISLRSANGVELAIDLVLDRPAGPAIRAPDPDDVHVP